MSFKFVNQPLASGLYEPEGIYLYTPFAGRCPIVQFWGEHAEYYSQFKYNGVPVKGHIGLDFAMPRGSNIYAVDQGRVIEISYEPQGFGRYIKLDHSWGESLYACLDEVAVDSGQLVARGAWLAYSGDGNGTVQPHLHFGIRIKPYNRFDGWGGFTDPLPYLSPADLLFPTEEDWETQMDFKPPALANERPGMRRP